MSAPTAYFNARLVDPASGYDGPGGVLVEDGVILGAGPSFETAPASATNRFDCKGLVLAPGLIDLRVKTGEPGAEHKETLASASLAAAAGGVTTMVVMPETEPVIDDVALVNFIAQRARDTAKVKVLPAAALSKSLEGRKMAEIGLMAEAGAVLFSTGAHMVSDAGVMRRAMQYAASFGVLVASGSEEPSLVESAVMNAGPLAARMGLKGAPAMAEWMGAARNLLLAETTKCRFLVDQLSTGRTLDLVNEAKRRGVRAHCTVAAHHLFFNELDVGDYLTYCKVRPPFRQEQDRLALIEGVRKGEIDAVVSGHDPQPPENKRLPFVDASFGAIGLETLLAAMLSLHHAHDLTLIETLTPLTLGPARLLGLRQGQLAAGAPADLVLFDLNAPWACKREDLSSRSKNSPFDGRRLQGKVRLTLVDGAAVFTNA
jgi:dihydroorotase